jgi:signal transduction histidine kinase
MSSVLIVDDSPADRALFRTILTRAGYVVFELGVGRDVVARARELRPHAIVLDVNLPDTDGQAVCRALKADPEVATLPVLMLTVRDNDADVLAGLEAGADDYVAKDAAPGIVLARVARLIQFRQLATAAVLNEHLVQVGRLLAGIIHEIRGPLSVIRGSAELMRYQFPEDDPRLQAVEPILRNTQFLQARLEHFMATVRSGAPVLQDTQLAGLVRESSELFLKGTDPRGCQVKVDTTFEEPLPPVRVDPGRLILVLLSLLGNAHEAISASGRGGRIALRVARTDDDGRAWLTIDVADDGPGIPATFIDRVFEPFFTTKEKGSGYGLYLASETLREQGGRLTVRNLPEEGACFTIWIPMPAPESA